MILKRILTIMGIVIVIITISMIVKSSNSEEITTNTINNQIQVLTLQVSIPCPGHAGLIMGYLYKNEGVNDVGFSLPNKFRVYYDRNITSEQDILSTKIFEKYPAKKIN